LVYLILLVGWFDSIRNRVTQKNLRNFLIAEHTCMLLGITIRFLQDALLPYFTEDVLTQGTSFIMRLSGYAIIVPMVLIPLFGLYASFGLGKTEEYRLNQKWYFLAIPAGMLMLLILTNESHHLIFHQLEDAQSNLYYQPNIGLFLVITWEFSLLFARIFLIYRRSRELSGYTARRFAPVLIAVIMILFNIPYVASSFVMEYELVEYVVSLFFMEVMIWESCILSGMVPVNTHYEDVFNRSTIAMQIVNQAGESYMKSTCAPELSQAMFEQLRQLKTVSTPEGQEYHLHTVSGGYTIWKNDISKTLSVIDALKKSSAKLEYDGELLRQELKLQSDTAAVREQNRLYNQLTDEVGEHLTLLRNLLRKREWTEDKDELFREICLIGTYIKRRCNLRLVEQSEGIISNKELELSYNEIIGSLRQMGVDASVLWKGIIMLTPEFAIFTLDLFEALLEYENFSPNAIHATFEPNSEFFVQVFCGAESSGQVPVAEIQRINKRNYDMNWVSLEGGYQVSAAMKGA